MYTCTHKHTPTLCEAALNQDGLGLGVRHKLAHNLQGPWTPQSSHQFRWWLVFLLQHHLDEALQVLCHGLHLRHCHHRLQPTPSPITWRKSYFVRVMVVHLSASLLMNLLLNCTSLLVSHVTSSAKLKHLFSLSVLQILIHSIYLSIYQTVIPLKGMDKTRHARVHFDITRSSFCAPCPFLGEYTEEGLPRPLIPSLYEPKRIWL